MTIHNPSFLHTSSSGRKASFGPLVRSDSAIEEEIWDCLSKENRGIFSPDHIAVEVDQGQVRLSGHVAEEGQRHQARLIAAQTPGVIQVRNEIVQDHDLRTRVLRALNKDERTALFLTPVKCSFGWISLGGIVPTPEAAELIEMVAGSISDVRGVIATPWVVGLPWANASHAEPTRKAFQPRIGAGVHESLEEAPGVSGLVAQVILDPHSRLLTHVVVQAREKDANQPAAAGQKRVIPVGDIEAANREHVWLKDGVTIDQYPILQAYRYPGVPQDWRPPFPYKPEMVRWSCR